MGDDKKTLLKLNFDSEVSLEYRGASIASDAGLLTGRDLDDSLSLIDSENDFLKESRGSPDHAGTETGPSFTSNQLSRGSDYPIRVPLLRHEGGARPAIQYITP